MRKQKRASSLYAARENKVVEVVEVDLEKTDVTLVWQSTGLQTKTVGSWPRRTGALPGEESGSSG